MGQFFHPAARKCDCIVSRADECLLDVSACPRSQSVKASEIEVEGYLRVWQALQTTIEVVKVYDLSPSK
jgi:hypothetical protein